MKLEKQLARVKKVDFAYEDHGILTCFVSLDKEDGLHQGFGGYCLDSFDKEKDRRVGTAAGMDYLIRLMNTFGVERLEDINGKMCYGLYDNNTSTLKGIESLKIDGGHKFLIKDWQEEWFPNEADKF